MSDMRSFGTLAIIACALCTIGCLSAGTTRPPIRPSDIGPQQGGFFGTISVFRGSEDATGTCAVKFVTQNSEVTVRPEFGGWIIGIASPGRAYLSTVDCVIDGWSKHLVPEAQSLAFDVPEGGGKIAYFGNIRIAVNSDSSGATAAFAAGAIGGAIYAASAANGILVVPEVQNRFDETMEVYRNRYPDAAGIKPVVSLAGPSPELAARRAELAARQAPLAARRTLISDTIKAGAPSKNELAAKLWIAWAAKHEENACKIALEHLADDAGCVGTECQLQLVLSDAYRNNCVLDTDAKIEIQRMRLQWEKQVDAKGSTNSE